MYPPHVPNLKTYLLVNALSAIQISYQAIVKYKNEKKILSSISNYLLQVWMEWDNGNFKNTKC